MRKRIFSFLLFLLICAVLFSSCRRARPIDESDGDVTSAERYDVWQDTDDLFQQTTYPLVPETEPDTEPSGAITTSVPETEPDTEPSGAITTSVPETEPDTESSETKAPSISETKPQETTSAMTDNPSNKQYKYFCYYAEYFGESGKGTIVAPSPEMLMYVLEIYGDVLEGQIQYYEVVLAEYKGDYFEDEKSGFCLYIEGYEK